MKSYQVLCTQLSILAALAITVSGCAKNIEKTEVKAPQASADIMLNADGDLDDKKLAQAEHINIAIDKNGQVIFQGIVGQDGKAKNHLLSEKDSKELLTEIAKANKGLDKQNLTTLIQTHVARLKQGL